MLPNDVDQRVVVFFRADRPNEVKTRLAAAIGDAPARRLYRGMLRDLEERLSPIDAKVRFYRDADGGECLFAQSVLQIGENLWDRMANAMEAEFTAGAESVVLIGTDIPGLSTEIIQVALGFLGQRNERPSATLGATRDGGYYLIGATRSAFSRGIFTAGARNRENAFAATREYLSNQQVDLHLLPVLRDIDLIQDLHEFLQFGKSDSPALLRIAAEILDNNSPG